MTHFLPLCSPTTLAQRSEGHNTLRSLSIIMPQNVIKETLSKNWWALWTMLGEFLKHQRRVVMARQSMTLASFDFWAWRNAFSKCYRFCGSSTNIVCVDGWIRSHKKQSYNQRDSKFKGEPRNLLFTINVREVRRKSGGQGAFEPVHT